jgi:hypothetical protein
MYHARTGIVLRSALVALLVLIAQETSAQLCGDTNQDGVVTDTDAVVILRAAAALSSNATERTADLNLDGAITDTDGVLALRMAAFLPASVSCVAQQASAVEDRSGVALKIGVGAIPGAAVARVAGSTSQCSGGGSIDFGVSSEVHHNCNQDGIVTNGTIAYNDAPPIFRNLFRSFSINDTSTGELLGVEGTLEFLDAEPIEVDGLLEINSNFVGEFSDEYRSLEIDDEGGIISGDILTDVIAGFGAFDSIDFIDFTFVSSGIVHVTVFFLDGHSEGTVTAFGLCDSCTDNFQCSEDLSCFSCDSDCSTGQSRCSVDFTIVDCGDGNFGPATTCDPCTSSAQCADSQGCFACDHDCTGNVNRCSSNVLFVNCGDGFF